MTNNIAVIRVRGDIHVTIKIKKTLRMLNLLKRYHCVVIPNNTINLGMIKKVKDYITWGEINPEIEKQLKEKRSEYYSGKKELKPYFRLHPPRGGFERKGTKVDFKSKGAIGYRKEKINDLILRML